MNTMQMLAQALYGQIEERSTIDTSCFEVSFLLGSRNLGSAKWPHQYSHEQRHVPYSRAYFCPKCGDIWARMFVHANPEHWTVSTRHCRRHVTRFSVIDSGTFIQYGGEIVQENFDIPLPVLVEDFLFLMTLFDKHPGSYEM